MIPNIVYADDSFNMALGQSRCAIESIQDKNFIAASAQGPQCVKPCTCYWYQIHETLESFYNFLRKGREMATGQPEGFF
jgi:hypothetical protein